VRSRELGRLIRSAILVAVLLLAQVAVAAHFDLDESHPAGDSCALCAGHSVLGAGNVGVTASSQILVREVPLAPLEQTARPESHRSSFLARGPPAAS
jgi:hypothetical protein